MLNYHDTGTGYPLLLIHGWGVTHSIWQHMAPELARSYRVISVELPGHGGTDLPDFQGSYYHYTARHLEALRKRLGIRRWGVISYSVGTRVAEEYSQRYGGAIDASVFICPLYLKHPFTQTIRHFLSVNRLTPESVDWIISKWRLQYFIQILGFNGRGVKHAHGWRQEMEQQDVAALKRMIADLPGYGRAPFAVPRTPSLFIVGTNDLLSSRPKFQASDVETVGNVTVISANHAAPLLHGERLTAAILPFLQANLPVAPAADPVKRQMAVAREQA